MSILNLLDRPIAYHRAFAAISGSICGGIFLSQAFYWSQRTSDPDGWFWKTQEQWFDETFMTRYEQETARKKLVSIGVLEQKKQGMPAKLFYRIDREALEVKMQKYAGIQHTGVMESNIQACGNPANKRDGIQQTSVMESNIHACGKPTNILYTETTPEITSEITQREEAHPQKALPELEEKSTQDQPIADQSASLSIQQKDSADDETISSETVFAAAPIFQPQKNNATANYEKRFASPHKYPALIEAGHGDIMIGTGYLDFDPIVVEVAVLHLKKHELACEVGDGKRFISNRIKQADWAAIELLKESAATIATNRKKTEAAIAASTNSESEYYDTTRYYVPEAPVIDVEARAKATEGGRAKMREILAEAKKKRAS